MLEGRRGAALGLTLFVALGAFGIWHEISSQHSPTHQTPHYTSDNSKANIDPRTSDERIADYTLWLERFTGLLALVSFIQILFLLRADKTARISAEAAKAAVELANREFIATHRPQLKVRRLFVVGFYARFEKTPLMPGDEINASLDIVNVGSSEATITWSRYRIYFGIGDYHTAWRYVPDDPHTSDHRQLYL